MELGDGGWAVSIHVFINYVLIFPVLLYAADTEFLFDTVDKE